MPPAPPRALQSERALLRVAASAQAPPPPTLPQLESVPAEFWTTQASPAPIALAQPEPRWLCRGDVRGLRDDRDAGGEVARMALPRLRFPGLKAPPAAAAAERQVRLKPEPIGVQQGCPARMWEVVPAQLAREPERRVGSGLRRLSSSIGRGESARPPRCTIARLHRSGRTFRTASPTRMPPWRRASSRRARQAGPLGRCWLSPCGCVPGSVANRPWPGIVAAAGRCGQLWS